MAKALRAAESTSTAGGAATATITGYVVGGGPSSGGQLYVNGVIVTVSAVPTAAAVATLTGTDALGNPSLPLHFQIGTDAVFPWMLLLPDRFALRIVSGQNAVLTVPTLGAAIVITAQLLAYVE